MTFVDDTHLCPTCDGDGCVWAGSYMATGEERFTRCLPCAGTGKVGGNEDDALDRIPGASYSNPIWHRRWRIYLNDFTAHSNAWQVAFVGLHDDFDGASDANDHRCLYAASEAALRAEIDEWELCNPERVYDRIWIKCDSCGGTGCVAIAFDGTVERHAYPVLTHDR